MAVYDCFLLNDEMDILEMRMTYLWDKVDHFIACESTTTFAGEPKPLLIGETIPAELERFRKKLLRVVVEPMREDYKVDVHGATEEGYRRFLREAWQRNAMTRPLQFMANPGDLVLISDVDEIPRIEMLDNPINWRHERAWEQKFYRYYLNVEFSEYWCGTVSSPWPLLLTPQEMRNRRYVLPRINDAGWHFSTMGDLEAKIKAFSHAEYDTPELIATAIQAKKELKDPFGRERTSWVLDPSMVGFPLIDDPRYSSLIYKENDEQSRE